jgi:2,3-bisphosphoglycerate-independent phosphoglycerate mutase
MGNSEVGHNALGAGRVFEQGAKLVERALAEGTIWEGAAWRDLVRPCVAEGRTLHLLGLLSDGNVHAHERHVWAMIREAARGGVRQIRLHVLTDGRDVPDRSAGVHLGRLEGVLSEVRREHGVDARIASGGGRMFVTMDRYEADWRIVERGWRAHVEGEAEGFPSAAAAIEQYRDDGRGASDQHLPPFVVVEGGRPIGLVQDGDAVVLWNFRGDRAIQITRAFEEPDFHGFPRPRWPQVRFAGMMQYDGDRGLPARFLVAPPAIAETMGELLAHSGVSQFACAETQKFGHVTYFWNGNRAGMFDPTLEEYCCVASDRAPFEERPWMKAAEVTDAVVDALRRPIPPRFLRINYANGDMVGHTGDLEATVIAVEAVDLSLGRLLRAIDARGGRALVTADHGNADQMFQIDKKSGKATREPLTSHTLNPVPLYLTGGGGLRPGDAGIASVSATALELLGFQPPSDWAPSLLVG